MQIQIAVFFLIGLTLTEGFIFGSKCPVKKHKATKVITGYDLSVHDDFKDGALRNIEKYAKDCKVHVYVTESFYKLKNPSDYVTLNEKDLAIGHGLKFELRDESNAILCNKLCLEKNPLVLTESKCFLQRARDSGYWSQYNPLVLSDGTYNKNVNGYEANKVDIQTKCQKEDLKRQVLRALRRMEEEQESDADNDSDSDDQERK